jgi:hypothetical protein
MLSGVVLHNGPIYNADDLAASRFGATTPFTFHLRHVYRNGAQSRHLKDRAAASIRMTPLATRQDHIFLKLRRSQIFPTLW